MDLLDKVQLENLDEEQKTLAELVGIEGFRNLVRTFNGTSIYIPKVESIEKTVRDEAIRDEFDGSNYRELALKYGLTEVWIRNIVLDKAKEIKARPVEGQISMFDLLEM
jgi:Mor family transcriptional regulator